MSHTARARGRSPGSAVNVRTVGRDDGAPVTFSTPVRSVRKGSKVEEWLPTESTYITRDILKGGYEAPSFIRRLVHLRRAFECISG